MAPPWLASSRVQQAGLVLLFAVAIVLGCAAGVLLAYETDLPQIESLEDFEPNIITQVYAADGSLIGDFAIERRVVVRFGDIPPLVRNAVIAVEDADFWKHLGINFWRIPAAAWKNLRAGRKSQGFSTLTMQLTRVLFLTPEKTYERKVKEAILAFQIEKNFTKEEIFTFYCNQVYFGHGNYGVEATSQYFFSKSIKDLTLPEAALVAGLPQNPSRLSPVDHPDRALARRNHVLDRMVEEKYITLEEGEKAKAAPLGLQLRRDPPSIAPYFVEEVRKYLEKEYGSQRIYQGGLRVHTTLDPAAQRAANRAMERGLVALDRRSRGFVRPSDSVLVDGRFPDRLHLDEWDRPFEPGDVVRGVVLQSERQIAVVRLGDRWARITAAEIAWTRRSSVAEVLPAGTVAPFLVESLFEEQGRPMAKVSLQQEPEVQGALVSIDVKSGAVRAMVGGWDFQKSKFNRATQAMRQVGSSFKPIVYAAAIETLGYTPATMIDDSPISFPDAVGMWSPHNFDYSFWGPIPLRRAVEQSRNIPAIKTLHAVGVQRGIDYARRLGLSGPLPPYLPIALGAGEATPTEMVAAFSAFGNQGLRMKPFLVTRITDRDGNVIEENRPSAKDAVRADTAYLVTTLLRGVVQRGTAARAASLGRPIAGKTGTTNDFTDAWFVGYEPEIAAAVWVGYDDKCKSLGRREEGSRAALPIWMDFWKEITRDRPVVEFSVPSNIVFVPVEVGGAPGAPGKVRMEAFVAGTEPGAASLSDTAGGG